MTRHALTRTGLLGTLIALAAGCADSPTELPRGPDAPTAAASVVADPAAADAPDPATGRQLAQLRRATARFHRFDAATEAGYGILVTHPTTGDACLADPVEGGMGRHYLNGSLVDDAVSVAEPEVVIYEPTEDGRLRLVGVEYIIPYAIRGPDEQPPTLFGRDFLHNSTFGLWMLHVWAWKHNPAGTFATWNPAVSCEHDDAVD